MISTKSFQNNHQRDQFVPLLVVNRMSSCCAPTHNFCHGKKFLLTKFCLNQLVMCWCACNHVVSDLSWCVWCWQLQTSFLQRWHKHKMRQNWTSMPLAFQVKLGWFALQELTICQKGKLRFAHAVFSLPPVSGNLSSLVVAWFFFNGGCSCTFWQLCSGHLLKKCQLDVTTADEKKRSWALAIAAASALLLLSHRVSALPDKFSYRAPSVAVNCVVVSLKDNQCTDPECLDNEWQCQNNNVVIADYSISKSSSSTHLTQCLLMLDYVKISTKDSRSGVFPLQHVITIYFQVVVQSWCSMVLARC